MKDLVEIDPSKILYSAQLSLLNKLNMARAEQVNIMIELHIPRWKIYLLKKSKMFARLFGIFTVIEPQTKLENDVIREKLILCTGSKSNPKVIAEKLFYIQDKRKINGGRNTMNEELVRYGKIKVPEKYYEQFWNTLGIIPYSIEFHKIDLCFHIECKHPLFQEISQGDLIPEYGLTIETREAHTLNKDEFKVINVIKSIDRL